MATRRTVLDVITTVFRAQYNNVSNKMYTPQQVLDLKRDSYAGNKFPWVCIGLGPHVSSLSLEGFRESEISIPLDIYVYVKVDDQDSLQVALADAMDTAAATIKNAYNTFNTNCFSVDSLEMVPMEDEQVFNVGAVLVVMTVLTATS